MANFNMVQAASFAAGNLPFATWNGARLRVMTDTLVYNSQASGSTLTFGTPVPTGALIVGANLNTDTSTGSTTLSLGTAASAALYSAAVAYTTLNQWVPILLKNAPLLTVLTAPTQLIFTTAAATAPASGNLIVQVLYVLD
jgi:hypothetical protein